MFTPVQDAIRPDEQCVTTVVPHKFNLVLDDGRQVSIPAGTQELPVIMATHPYAKANGVEIYGDLPPPVASAPQTAPRRGRPKATVSGPTPPTTLSDADTGPTDPDAAPCTATSATRQT